MATGLIPGSLVGGYRVETRIGSGAMAMVLRAVDDALGRTVALKILPPALAGGAEFRGRFIREARMVAAVDHPNIIPVYAAGESGGVLYLAMRYVPSGDLRALAEREAPLAGGRAADLLSPIASALDVAHAAGLVHRDVKPANILVDIHPGRPDHPFLSDFGLAKGSSGAGGLTGNGQFVGTPDYSAPEQIAGRRSDPRTDQYALGCVAYAVLAGRPPFVRDDPMSVMWAHVHEAPPPLTERRPDLPAAADQVIARAMAKDPADRYRSCGEFAAALQDAFRAGREPAGADFGRFQAPAGDQARSARPSRSQPDFAPPTFWAAEMEPSGSTRPRAPQSRTSPSLLSSRPGTMALDFPAPGSTAVALGAEDPDLPPPPGNAGRRPRSRRRRGRVVAAALALVLLLLAGGGYAFAEHERSQGGYFVGSENGYVAVFKGADHGLLGVTLSRVALLRQSDTKVQWLSPDAKARVARTIATTSQASGVKIIAGLRAQANSCGGEWWAIYLWQQKAQRHQDPGPEPPVPDAASCAPASAFNITLSAD
jgi:serine/threonine-protein kinase